MSALSLLLWLPIAALLGVLAAGIGTHVRLARANRGAGAGDVFRCKTRMPDAVGPRLPPGYGLRPAGYGGIESVCATLVEQLVDHGHDVTVFGVGKGATAGRFVSLLDESQYPRLGEAMPAALYAARVVEALTETQFDVV